MKWAWRENFAARFARVILSKNPPFTNPGSAPASDLSWSLHITNKRNKARRLVGLLYRRCYEHASCSTVQKLYISFVRPHLEYASIVWNSYLKSDIYKLEDVQKFALSVCLKSWDCYQIQNFSHWKKDVWMPVYVISLKIVQGLSTMTHLSALKRIYTTLVRLVKLLSAAECPSQPSNILS